MTNRPFVLIIDDDDQDSFAFELESLHGVEAAHTYPDEINYEDLARANLILVDEFIEDWPTRKSVQNQPGLYVRDGIALSGVLRATLDGRGPSPTTRPNPSRTAIVLRTGHLGTLAAGTPAFMRPMAVAGRHDLEWVTEKGATTAKEFALLASAAAELPHSWDPSNPAEQLDWLQLPDTKWRARALAQIEQCRPPWSVLAASSAGRQWLAWFCQKILPFPTFLIDDLRAAAFLGLTVEGLQDLLKGDSTVVESLGACTYRGQLSEFPKRRWWRAGISSVRQELLSRTTDHDSADIANRLIELHGSSLSTLAVSTPVFPIDTEYKTLDEPIEIRDAVRLQPDGWPTFADTPWLAFSELENEPELQKLIVLQDREELGGDDSSDD